MLWSGSGDVGALPTESGAPAYASDMFEFRGHIFAVNTPASAAATQFSDYGLAKRWDHRDNIFDITRDSEAVNGAVLNNDVALVLHRKSVHRLTPASLGASRFDSNLVDGTVGSWARSGCVTANGKCYFVGGKQSATGIFLIDDPFRRAKYISEPVRDTWATLDQDRIQQSVAVVRGEPWNEIAWLFSSSSSSEHDIQIVYNWEYDTWTVFDSPHDDYTYAGAANYVDSSGRSHTLLFGYDGIVYDAWGDGTHVDTGNLDGGPSGGYIESVFETGYLDLGYRGQKGLREMWFDVETEEQVSFDVTVRASDTITPVKQLTAGTPAAKLGAFTLGTSKLASRGVRPAKRKVEREGRFMRLRSVENGTVAPHRVLATHWSFVRQGARF